MLPNFLISMWIEVVCLFVCLLLLFLGLLFFCWFVVGLLLLLGFVVFFGCRLMPPEYKVPSQIFFKYYYYYCTATLFRFYDEEA